MKTVLERLPRSARVAVVRLRSLGDCVLTTPALEILHGARPDLKIAVVVEDRFAAVFAGNPAVERTVPPSLSLMARLRPALCLNLHGGPRSLALTLASQARLRAGFAHFRMSAVYNVRIPRAQEILGVDRTVHTAEHLASAVFHLGAPRREIPHARLYAKPPAEAKRPYAVIHPVASSAAKTWPADGFLKVAEHLKYTWGLESVFIAGPGEDLSAFATHGAVTGVPVEEISAFAPHRTIAGAPLEDVKSLLAGASLFIGNDSGPAHMAAALGVPVAVIFGASNPAIWGPWKCASRTLVAESGIENLPAGDVIAAADELMKVPA